MITTQFHHPFKKEISSFILGLTYLPPLPPTTALKEIRAENCSIKTIHESFFRPDVKIDLKNNNILEIPRDKVLDYLNKGGKLGPTHKSDEPSAINLAFNPLDYPPRNVYDEGLEAVTSYLKKYPNSMVNPNDITITLIGVQKAGKTSFAHFLARKISSAAEIKEEDRTQAFDVLRTYIKDLIFTIFDLGGHEEYEICLPFLSRDNGLHISVLNPADLADDASLERAMWSWIQKLLEITVTPHLLVVITKMDTVDPNELESEKKQMKETLVSFLERKLDEVKQMRNNKKEKIEEDMEEVEERLTEVTRVRRELDGCPTATVEEKQKWEAEESDIMAQKHLLQNKLSKQIFKVNHLPNLNPDCISFISSMTGAGFDALENNFLKVIERLPTIKLQEHWMKTAKALLTTFQEKAFVVFDDLLKESDLSKDDLMEMLKALNAMGKIFWSSDADRCEVIFHRPEQLSVMMKSFNYHGMPNLLEQFAGLKRIEQNELLEKYAEGQLPLELIESTFDLITTQNATQKQTIKIDYDDLRLHDPSKGPSDVLKAFLSTLTQLKTITIMEETFDSMKMIFCPDLLFKRAGPQDQRAFIRDNSCQSAFFELQIFGEFESFVGKRTFSKSCITTLNFMKRLAEVTKTKREHTAKDKALVTKCGQFQIVLHHDAIHHEGNTLGLCIKALDSSLLPDTVWILLKDLLIALNLDETDCHLECPKRLSDCDHGKLNFNDSLENVKSPRKKKKKPKCGSTPLLPTQMAMTVTSALHPSDGQNISPLSSSLPPLEDLVETENLLSILLTAPIEDKSKVKEHPVFCKESYDKLCHFIRPLRQLFDDLSTICSHGKKGCQCFRSLDEYCQTYIQVERNGGIITKGDWHNLLKPIFDAHKCSDKEPTGLPCSVTAMVREVRNLIAHAKFGQNKELWARIRAATPFLVMHGFASLILTSSSPDPTMKLFADSFLENEAISYKSALDSKDIERPAFAPLKVQLVRANGSESQTTFYLDTRDSKNETQTLSNEISQIFQLDKNTPLRITYMGELDSAAPLVHSDNRLTSPSCITDLNLDTSNFHLALVEEKWKIAVESNLPGKVIKQDFFSDDTVLEVQRLVQDETGWDKVLLFHGKNILNKNAKLGNVIIEDHLELFATDPADKDRREEYQKKF